MIVIIHGEEDPFGCLEHCRRNFLVGFEAMGDLLELLIHLSLLLPHPLFTFWCLGLFPQSFNFSGHFLVLVL